MDQTGFLQMAPQQVGTFPSPKKGKSPPSPLSLFPPFSVSACQPVAFVPLPLPLTSPSSSLPFCLYPFFITLLTCLLHYWLLPSPLPLMLPLFSSFPQASLPFPSAILSHLSTLPPAWAAPPQLLPGTPAQLVPPSLPTDDKFTIGSFVLGGLKVLLLFKIFTFFCTSGGVP